MGTLTSERVGTAGLSITMKSELDRAVEWARENNPGALADPDLRDRLARAYTQIEMTRLLNMRALSKVLKGEKGWPEVQIAKLQWSHLAQTLAELQVDLLGPAGAARARRPGRRRQGPVDAALQLPALHLDRRRYDAGAEEHHRRPRDQAAEEVERNAEAPNTLQLAGSAVLVTGASTGIGAATARALGAAGARVGLVARRKELLDQVAEETRAAGSPDVEVWAADLSDLPLAEQIALEAWKRFDGLDGLVNNAGAPKRKHVTRLTAEEVEDDHDAQLLLAGADDARRCCR